MNYIQGGTDMNRTLPKYLVTTLLLLLLFTASSCEKTKESSTVGSSSNAAQASLAPTSQPTTAETSTSPTISPASALPPEIVFDMSGDQTNTYAENLYVEANETSISVIGGGNEPVHINGSIANVNAYCNSMMYQISRVEYAMDGSSLAIQLDCNSYGSGRLVFTDGTAEIDIASNVDSYHMSGDGSAVLYLVTPKYEHGVGGDLYYYDCVTGTSQLITKGAGRLFTVSPNGDSISYTTFYKVDDPDALSCYSLVIGKAPSIVDTDSYCVTISDDAGTVYYLKKTDEGEALFVRYDGVAKQLSQPYAPLSYNADEAFFFNIDQTQIVFNSDGSTYFSMSGSDSYKISDYQARSFLGKSNFYDTPDYLYKTITDSARSYVTVSVYGTKNLCYVPFQTDDQNLFYFDKNMKVTEYAPPENSYDLHFSYSALITHDNDNCYIFKNYLDPDYVQLPAVTYALVTEDQTLFYLSTESTEANFDSSAYIDNLYVTFGSFDTTNGELIASHVAYLELLAREGPDILYFLAYPEDHDEEIARDSNLTTFWDLYAVEEIPGAKPVLIAKSVCNYETGDFGVVYWQYKDVYKGDFEPMGASYMATVGVYSSKDGKSFQYVMERPYVLQFGG